MELVLLIAITALVSACFILLIIIVGSGDIRYGDHPHAAYNRFTQIFSMKLLDNEGKVVSSSSVEGYLRWDEISKQIEIVTDDEIEFLVSSGTTITHAGGLGKKGKLDKPEYFPRQGIYTIKSFKLYLK